ATEPVGQGDLWRQARRHRPGDMGPHDAAVLYDDGPDGDLRCRRAVAAEALGREPVRQGLLDVGRLPLAGPHDQRQLHPDVLIRMGKTGRRILAALALTGLACAAPARAEPPPARVVSINVCTDQYAMLIAGEGQLHSVSHLAADPYSSAMVEE